METDRLAAFCAIVEAGSLTGAAELLGVSHSGLSKAMSLLQRDLGLRLLKPRGRGLEVTDEGKDVYRRSKELLAHVADLRAGSAKPAPKLRIGIPESLSHALAGSLAKALASESELAELDAGELETRLLDGTLNFGFTFVPFPEKEIEHIKIEKATFASFARRGAFNNTKIEEIPYVIPASDLRDNPLSLTSMDGWNRKLARWAPLRASNMTLALGMVHAGMAAIYIPTFVALALNALLVRSQELAPLDLPKARRVSELTRRDLFLVKRHSDEETPVMRRATRAVRTSLAEARRASLTPPP